MREQQVTNNRKVFGIGFQKTGTTSLGTIFDKLGIEVGVIISDTFGRPWRRGLTDVGIG